MSQGPFLSRPLRESVDGLLPAFLRWADWQKCLWLLCSWAATNNSGFYPGAVCNNSTLAVFEALNSCPLSLQYVVLFGGDLSADLTACFPTPWSLLGKQEQGETHQGRAANPQLRGCCDSEGQVILVLFMLGQRELSVGDNVCSWPPVWFLDWFYLPQPRAGLWWSVTGEDIPEANPDDAWLLNSGRSHLSCCHLSISELLLEQTAQQLVDCLCCLF